MPVSEATYQRIAMEDDDTWELVCGRLRKKPAMTTEHNDIPRRLLRRLILQLPEDMFRISEAGKLRTSAGSYYVPDLCVIPTSYVLELHEQPGTFEAFEDPVPFVLEVWSPSTGEYDVDEKLPEYRRRGDLEIWRIHPYERTLMIWRKQADGSYTEIHHPSGPVEIASLPGVVINLDELFL
ncbi:MAG: Uma2 family endonuclease [Chloroflexi bacterium]|nr:Uma2 family endonuclease [Chloroflexota bacterium]